MKTAWELALERSGGALDELSDKQKDAIAEIDKICKAKLAEMDLAYSDKLKNANSREELEQIKEDMAVERASITSKAERDKEKIRNGKS
jgi:hypothetical protein